MTTHRILTDAYLAQLAADGPDDAGVAEDLNHSVDATTYRAHALARPVFLGHAEYAQVSADISNVHNAIVALPDRLFGGDLEKLARAVGMPDEQVAAVVRCHSPRPPVLSRADLFLEESGFRMMELNMGSTMGGFDNGFLNEAMLNIAHVKEFVTEHRLGYIDTVAELARTIRTFCQVPEGTRPVMALADWPESYKTLEPQLHKSAKMLAMHGLDPIPCHIGQLTFSDGAVWLGEQRIDIIYRLFCMPDLMEPEGPGLIEPIFDAVERGDAKLFVPMDSYVFGSKGALAMLSDEANRHLLTDAERDSIDRLLPWTRMLRPGPVTIADQAGTGATGTGVPGEPRTVQLEDYVFEQQNELILKPTLLFAGEGITQGWHCTPEQWREQIEAAMGGPYLVQRRIRPVPELFPGKDGLEPWTVVWASFNMADGAAGMFLRGLPGDDPGVINVNTGASGVCAFVAEPPTGG